MLGEGQMASLARSEAGFVADTPVCAIANQLFRKLTVSLTNH
jgi:hypothetical protein